MSFAVDRRGRPYNERRYVDTVIKGQLLVGRGWEAIAHSELKRLTVEVGIYHQQLKGNPGFDETADAILSLEAACEAIAEKANVSEEDDVR